MIIKRERENKNLRKIINNFLYSLSGNIFSKILSFLVVAFITRTFGSEIFGQYNIATAEYSYFSMFALFGLDAYGLFLMAKADTHERKIEIFKDIFSVKTIIGILVAVILVIYAFLIPNSHKFTVVFVGVLAFQGVDCLWVFNSFQDMKVSAYKGVVTAIGYAGLVLVFYLLNLKHVIFLLLAYTLPILLYNLYAVARLKKQYKLVLGFSKPHIFSYLKNGFPYMASGIFAGINMNIDIIIMGYTISASEIGYYSADYKIVSEFVTLSGVLFVPFYLVFIEKFNKGEYEYVNRITGYLKTVIICGMLPCTIVGIIYGGEILQLLFGKEYVQGRTALAILMIYAFLVYYREIYGYTLTAAGKQFIYMRIVALSASFNIITNLILIPHYGINAAAVTTLISECINFCCMRYVMVKKVGLKVKNYRLIRTVIPLVALVVCLLLARNMKIYFIVAIAVALLVYAILLVLCKVFEKEIIKNITSRNLNE